MIRFSLIFGSMGVALLIAAPWVAIDVRLPVYLLGIASLVLAALSHSVDD
jgi:hypothetical protein